MGPVPGLAVTYALTGDVYSDDHGYLQTVECFLYPGSGQTIITAGTVRFDSIFISLFFTVLINFMRVRCLRSSAPAARLQESSRGGAGVGAAGVE